MMAGSAWARLTSNLDRHAGRHWQRDCWVYISTNKACQAIQGAQSYAFANPTPGTFGNTDAILSISKISTYIYNQQFR
jgi:hypothetical protein